MNLDEKITILHAPNGYGKTVILNMISAFFSGNLVVFRKYEYSDIFIEFDSGLVVKITQRVEDKETLFRDDVISSEERTYTISANIGGDVVSYDPYEIVDARDRFAAPPSQLERHLSGQVRRVGPNQWRDLNTGEYLTTNATLERYADYLPSRWRRAAPRPPWLEEIRKSIPCRLIETQRLSAKAKDQHSPESSGLTPAVKHYADALSASMARLLAESANLSQSLDRTFPKRLLSRLENQQATATEFDVRQALTDLESRRARLAKADLLDIAGEDSVISHAHFGVEAQKVLIEYVEDTRKKLSVFDNMLLKIELFSELINNRFQFKKVVISRQDGFIFEDKQGRPLSIESLSSGEQHELVLAYELIFATPAGALLLIDEPEISLHIAW